MFAVAGLLVPSGSASAPRDEPVPILMYHLINAPPSGAPLPALYVAPSAFRAQMNWLARHHFRAVTLQRVYDHWRTGRWLPRRPVVISFDDGYLSQYTFAFPILRAYRWPGVVNLEVRHLRPVGGLLPWRIRKLIRAHWEIDAHTITHPDLTTLGDARLWYEVHGSRVRIRREFHVPVNFFCYPSGRYDARVIKDVRRAGFLGATTTTFGLARPPHLYILARVRITGTDGVHGFAAKLRGLLAASAY
jgi:peptidoglycan/xylan/chitin deacetylase (PgdA/CDA1 family)